MMCFQASADVGLELNAHGGLEHLLLASALLFDQTLQPGL